MSLDCAAHLEYTLLKSTSCTKCNAFQATSKTFPGAAYLLSASFSGITLLLAIFIHLSLKGKRFSEVVMAPEPKEESDEKKYRKYYDGFSGTYDDISVSHI